MVVEGADWTGTDLATSLAELSARMLSVADIDEALGQLTRMAVQIIPESPSCGITMVRHGQPVTVAYTGAIPPTADERQYALGDGPCLQALRTRVPVLVQDLTAEQRWSDYSQTALAAGARGVYAHPLAIEDQAVCSLNIYAPAPNLFIDEVRHVVSQVTGHAEVLLSAVLVRRSQVELNQELREALSSHATDVEELRKENAELQRRNEILRTASACLAQRADPTRRE